MKKIILTFALFAGFQVNFAQHGTSGFSACTNQLLTDLSTCLNGNGITFHLVDGGADGLYLYAMGSFPPGQLNSCLVHYDNGRAACPDAPVIVNKTDSRGIKTTR